MIVLQDYLRIHVDFQPFWEKPPLFFWMQVMGMKIFGIGEFGARLPNAICGIATLVVLYKMGSQLFDRRFGALWSLTYLGALFPHIYFKTGLIDPWFNFFIFCGLYFFILSVWRKDGQDDGLLNRKPLFYIALSGLIIGLGILTKGPVALLVPGLCVVIYMILTRFKLPASIPQLLLWVVLSFVTMLTWYGFETLKNGPWFVTEFTKYQVHLFSQPGAGHSGFPGYHFVVNLFGVFPASIIGLPALFYLKPKKTYQRSFRLWMVIFFWVVIVLFSIVQSKIIHYSSLTYFPLTFLSTLTIVEVFKKTYSWKQWVSTLLVIVGLPLGIAVLMLPIVGVNIETFASYINDEQARLSVQLPVDWQYWQSIFGLVFLAGVAIFIVLRKRGQLVKGYVIMLLCTAFMTNGVATVFYPRILTYSQGSMVDFWKSLEGVDCYATTLGYKSYSQFFYTNKQPGDDPRGADWYWLLTGDIDKPAFFVTEQRHVAKFVRQQPALQIIDKKGRHVLMKRDP